MHSTMLACMPILYLSPPMVPARHRPSLLPPLVPGEGGNDLLHSRQQVADQQLKRGNKALAGNIMVRVAK